MSVTLDRSMIESAPCAYKEMALLLATKVVRFVSHSLPPAETEKETSCALVNTPKPTTPSPETLTLARCNERTCGIKMTPLS